MEELVNEKTMFKVPRLSTGNWQLYAIRLFAFLAAKNGADIALKEDFRL